MGQQELKQERAFKLVSWPCPQDYNEAVQTPRFSFRDRGLMASTPALDRFGLPLPVTGNFASVYNLSSEKKNYAVRCFLRNIHGQTERYAAITSTLEKLSLPFTVRCEYLQEGITLWGTWFPILKMDWCAGVPLEKFIEQNIRQPDALQLLTEKLLEVSAVLRENGLAHGDLQHGNILVEPDGVKLVDYDGMYLPQFKGDQSNEIGHRNYQHPARTMFHFDETLDNFSAWVIRISLLCVIRDPDLWETLGGGDDCLLFRHSDFTSPEHSVAFYVLENHRSEEVRKYGRFLRSLLSRRPQDVPFPDATVNDVLLEPIALHPCDTTPGPGLPAAVRPEGSETRQQKPVSSFAAQRYYGQPGKSVNPMPVLVFGLVLMFALASAINNAFYQEDARKTVSRSVALELPPVVAPTGASVRSSGHILASTSLLKEDSSASPGASTPARDTDLHEQAVQLYQEAQKYDDDNMSGFAFESAKKSLDLLGKAPQKDLLLQGKVLALLGHLQSTHFYAKYNQPEKYIVPGYPDPWLSSREVLQTALNQERALPSPSDYRLYDIYHWLGHARYRSGQSDIALEAFESAERYYLKIDRPAGLPNPKADIDQVFHGTIQY